MLPAEHIYQSGHKLHCSSDDPQRSLNKSSCEPDIVVRIQTRDLVKAKKKGLNHIIMEMSSDPITTHYYMNHCNIVASMHATIDIEINSQVLTDTHRSKGQKYKLEETLETGLEIRGTQ